MIYLLAIVVIIFILFLAAVIYAFTWNLSNVEMEFNDEEF
tara:strand:- start:1224 stop:1343 length:120 start_codon:yes stop_codon:yes gene_type:complete